ncbi:hypothetical protein Tco_0552052 [Tanacetum coccineum]
MAVESTVPQLVDKKGGSYAAIAPKLKLEKFNKRQKGPHTTPSTTPISTAFFSNNVIQDFQENSDDENHARNGEWIDITMRKRHIRDPIWYLDSVFSRSMTGVKSYLYKYVEQPGPKIDDKQGTIFNANKEIVLIALRRNDIYVLDMSSLTPNGACFFTKASESIN